MDLFIKKFDTTMSYDFKKDGEKYVFETGSIPNISTKDAVSVNENGKVVDLKILTIQTITYKGHQGRRIIAIPIAVSSQEVKINFDVSYDGRTFSLKPKGRFSVTNEAGDTVQLEADPFEITAKQIEGAK